MKFSDPFPEVRGRVDAARDSNPLAFTLLSEATRPEEKHAHPLTHMSATIALAIGDEQILAHEWWTTRERDTDGVGGVVACAVVTPTRLIEGEFREGDSDGHVGVRAHSTITHYGIWLPYAMRAWDFSGGLSEPLAMEVAVHYTDGKTVTLGSRVPRATGTGVAPGLGCAAALFDILNARN